MEAPDKTASRDGRLQKQDRLESLFGARLIIEEQEHPGDNQQHKCRKSKPAEAKGISYPEVFLENKPGKKVFEKVFEQS